MSHNNESSKILTKADSEFCYQSKQKEKTIVLPNAPQQINYRESFILYTKENANQIQQEDQKTDTTATTEKNTHTHNGLELRTRIQIQVAVMMSVTISFDQIM